MAERERQKQVELATRTPELTPQQRFAYTPAQLTRLEQRTLSYLRQTGLVVTPDTLKRARAVVGIDAVERALLLEGREAVQPNDRIDTLVRAGLDARESLRERTKSALDPLRNLPTTSTEPYIGPYALPRDPVRQAAMEMQTFFVSPTLSGSETVARLHTYREVILGNLADTALQTVSGEQFPDAALERFPEPNDRAKLVRNMITSLVLRDDPSPVISINDLSDMLEDPELIKKLIVTNPIEKMIPYLPEERTIPYSYYTEYIANLYVQIRHGFHRYLSDTKGQTPEQESITNSRDLIYSGLSNTLLLLHPALEERYLVTNTETLKPGDFSIWSDRLSTQIGSYRVPNLDGLSRASRLAEARGYTHERFQSGIEAWRQFHHNVEFDAKRVEALTAKIQDLEASIQETQQGRDVPEGQARFYLHRIDSGLANSYSAARKEYQQYSHTIKRAEERRQQIETYVTEIGGLEGNPNEVLPLPEWLYELRMRGFSSGIEDRIKRAEVRIAVAGVRLAENRYWQERFRVKHSFMKWLSLSEEDVKDYLTQAREDELTYELPKNSTLTMERIRRDITDDRERIDAERSTNRHLLRSKRERARYKQLERIDDLLNRFDKGEVSEAYIRLAYDAYTRSEGRRMLEDIYGAKQAIYRAETRSEIPPSPTWTRKQMCEYIDSQRYRVLTREQALEMYRDEGQFQMMELLYHDLSRYITGISGGGRLTTRETLKDWFQSRIANTYKEIRKRQGLILQYQKSIDTQPFSSYLTANIKIEKNNIAQAGQKIDAMNRFIGQLDNPLLPIDESEGETFNTFSHRWVHRMSLVRSYARVDQAKQTLDSVEKHYKVALREAHIQRLANTQARLKRERDDVIANPPAERKFLGRMNELGFAVEVTDPRLAPRN